METPQTSDDNGPKFKLVAHVHEPSYTSAEEVSEAQLSKHVFFRSAQWTADGTSIITGSSDNSIRTYIIPPDLLDDRPEALPLQAYSVVSAPEPVDAITTYPGFSLQDPPTALVLSTINEHPIRLNSLLTAELVATYPLINSATEAYIKPHCMSFIVGENKFVCGSDTLISTFDLSCPGQEPVSSIRTGYKGKGKLWDYPGVAVQGIISSLAIDQQYNVLAAGSLSRSVALYDSGGQGECIGVFSIRGTAADNAVSGRGLTQLIWSPCGKYLYVAERKSDGIVFYDIRNTGQQLGWLTGRHADTNQRLHVDLENAAEGAAHSIWAGGTDGAVRSWNNPHLTEGAVKPSQQDKLHDDAVNSAVVHKLGGVLATSSGQRYFNDTATASSLRVWSF